jgi:hypothetical protein
MYYHALSIPFQTINIWISTKQAAVPISNLLAIDDSLEPLAPEWFAILLCQEDLLLLLNHATIKKVKNTIFLPHNAPFSHFLSRKRGDVSSLSVFLFFYVAGYKCQHGLERRCLI